MEVGHTFTFVGHSSELVLCYLRREHGRWRELVLPNQQAAAASGQTGVSGMMKPFFLYVFKWTTKYFWNNLSMNFQ